MQLDQQLEPYAWPVARLAEAIGALAKHCGCPSALLTESHPTPAWDRETMEHSLATWLESCADGFDLEAVPIEATYYGLTWKKQNRPVATWDWANCWTACPQGWHKWWVRPAGN